jgi:hypothetical protein
VREVDFYCRKCGAETEVEQRDAHRFDTDLGWPMVDSRYVCPNKRLPLDGHSKSVWESRRIDPHNLRGRSLEEAIEDA